MGALVCMNNTSSFPYGCEPVTTHRFVAAEVRLSINAGAPTSIVTSAKVPVEKRSLSFTLQPSLR